MIIFILSAIVIAALCYWVDREEGREYFKKHGYTRKAFKQYRKMINNPDYRKEQNKPKDNLNIYI